MYILVGMFLKARHFCPSLYISLSISPLPYRNTGPGPGPSPALAPAFIPLRAESAGRTPQLIVFRHRDREAGLILPAVPERPFTHRESSAFRSVCGVRPGKDTSAGCPLSPSKAKGPIHLCRKTVHILAAIVPADGPGDIAKIIPVPSAPAWRRRRRRPG